MAGGKVQSECCFETVNDTVVSRDFRVMYKPDFDMWLHVVQDSFEQLWSQSTLQELGVNALVLTKGTECLRQLEKKIKTEQEFVGLYYVAWLLASISTVCVKFIAPFLLGCLHPGLALCACKCWHGFRLPIEGLDVRQGPTTCRSSLLLICALLSPSSPCTGVMICYQLCYDM